MRTPEQWGQTDRPVSLLQGKAFPPWLCGGVGAERGSAWACEPVCRDISKGNRAGGKLRECV